MDGILQSPVTRFGTTKVFYGLSPSVERLGQHFEPWLRGDEITFPYRFSELEMYGLLAQTQFVAMVRSREEVYFGGTDEMPFLVEIDRRLIRVLRDAGEGAFYQHLKPAPVHALEARFGTERTSRQGDVYAYRLPVSWEQIADIRRGGQRRPCQPRDGREMPVSHTRHRITGRVAPTFKGSLAMKYSGELIPVQGMVVEGVLNAPDHAPRQLLGGPHLLVLSESVVRRRMVATPHSRRWLGD